MTTTSAPTLADADRLIAKLDALRVSQSLAQHEAALGDARRRQREAHAGLADVRKQVMAGDADPEREAEALLGMRRAEDRALEAARKLAEVRSDPQQIAVQREIVTLETEIARVLERGIVTSVNALAHALNRSAEQHYALRQWQHRAHTYAPGVERGVAISVFSKEPGRGLSPLAWWRQAMAARGFRLPVESRSDLEYVENPEVVALRAKANAAIAAGPPKFGGIRDHEELPWL